MKIVFATNNLNKLKEIQLSLGDSFNLLSLTDIQFEGDIPETGDTLEANASEKANYIAQRCKYPVFSDDTGLEVDFLNGKPGVHTAHYSGSRDAIKNMTKVLSELGDTSQRKAQFRTVIAFVDGQNQFLFEGKVTGQIAFEPRGDQGFGYDPIFIPENEIQTFAQMSMQEKAQQNHRVRAFKKFVNFLKNRQTQSLY